MTDDVPAYSSSPSKSDLIAWLKGGIQGKARFSQWRRNKKAKREIDLSFVDFSGLDLSGLNLSDIDFTGSVFNGTSLIGTNFRGATLKRANFVNATLKDADLTGAQASQANFTHVRSLEGVKVDENTNLHEVIASLHEMMLAVTEEGHKSRFSLGFVHQYINSNGGIDRLISFTERLKETLHQSPAIKARISWADATLKARLKENEGGGMPPFE